MRLSRRLRATEEVQHRSPQPAGSPCPSCHHAPLVTRRVTNRPSAPWGTDAVVLAKNELRRTERQWRSSRLVVHKEIFTKQRATYTSCVRSAKKRYLNEKISSSTSSKQLYAVTNQLLGKAKSSPLPSNIPHPELPDRFCHFFDDKFRRIRTDLDSKHASPPFFSSLEGVKLCTFEPVSEEVTAEIISKSPEKSCDLDPMPTSLVKSCLTELVPVITQIINASLLTGIVPAEFKHAMVKPLLKKFGLDPDDLKNV